MESKLVMVLPDDVFAAAEVLAHRLGLTRGALYALAVSELVACHRRLHGAGPAEEPVGGGALVVEDPVPPARARWSDLGPMEAPERAPSLAADPARRGTRQAC